MLPSCFSICVLFLVCLRVNKERKATRETATYWLTMKNTCVSFLRSLCVVRVKRYPGRLDRDVNLFLIQLLDVDIFRRQTTECRGYSTH